MAFAWKIWLLIYSDHYKTDIYLNDYSLRKVIPLHNWFVKCKLIFMDQNCYNIFFNSIVAFTDEITLLYVFQMLLLF